MDIQLNYPDWCTGREKLRAIDLIEDGCLGEVIREDILSELEQLERERAELDERIGRLAELLGFI